MDGAMRNAELAAVPRCERDFLVIVLGAVVEAHGTDDGVLGLRLIKRCDRIHAATDKNDGFHLGLAWLSTKCSAMTVSEMPPRAANLPSIRILRGAQAAMRSSRM